ncbi:MAG: hypothetical protein ACRBEE_05870 [Arenicella sp.]
MATREEMINALRNADAAGDVEAAKRIAAMLSGGGVQSSQSLVEQMDAAEAAGDTALFNKLAKQGFEQFKQGNLEKIETDKEKFPEQTEEEIKSNRFELKKSKMIEGVSNNKDSGTFIDSVNQGMTFGFGDEMTGAFGAFMNSINLVNDDMTVKQSYELFRDIARARNDKFSDENPKAALTGEIVGAATTGGAGLSKTLGAKIGKDSAIKLGAKGAGVGAAEGSIYGAGSSEADLLEGEVKDFAMDTAVGGGIGGTTGGLASGGIGFISAKMAKNKEIAQILQQKPTDNRAAGYVLKGEKALKSKEGQAALKQGVDEGAVAIIKGSTKEDKIAFRRMLNIVKRGQTDRLFKEANSPSDIVGETVTKRYQHVKNVNKRAANQLNAVANRLKGKEVEADQVLNDFISELQSKFRVGVTNDAGNLVPNFNLSSVENVAESQKVIKNIFNRINKIDKSDAFELHNLKKMIDEDVSYGKSQGGVSGQVDGLLQVFRGKVDGLLDEKFPIYNKANTAYSETISVLNDFDKAVGKSVSELTSNNDKAIGTVMRRLTSNVQTRQKLGNSFDALEDVASKYGAKFEGNVRAQASIANELERVFKLSGSNTLKGQVGQGVAENAIDAAGRSTALNIMEGAKTLANKSRGINEQQALIALRRLSATK